MFDYTIKMLISNLWVDVELVNSVVDTLKSNYRSSGKIRRKKFSSKPGMTKINHVKIFLPHINSAVYNGSVAC